MKYSITFSAVERHNFSAYVEASSKDEAFQLLKNDPWDYVEEEAEADMGMVIDTTSFQIETND